MIRALEETEIEGVKTTIPADLAILRHPDFIAGEHSTKWVEERLDLSGLVTEPGAPAPVEGEPAKVERVVDVEVDGRRYSVKLWVPDVASAVVVTAGGSGASRASRPRPPTAHSHGASTGSGNVTVPMQGTIIKVLVEVGAEVEVGQTVAILEAMKMENAITAEKAGTVKEVKVAAGDSVGPGDVIAVIE